MSFNRHSVWILGVALIAGAAQGGTISMRVSCGVQGTNLYVRLENAGDEAARNVSANVAFNGRNYPTPPMPQLPPKAPAGVVLGLRSPATPGTYPAVVTVHFEDLNAYPFSSVTVQPVVFGEAGTASLMGAVTGGKIRGKGVVKLRLRNDADYAISATGRVITAREIAVDEPNVAVNLAPHGRESLRIPLENFTAMPASRYPVHVVMEYDREGVHYTSIASTGVQMFPASAWRSSSFWAVLVVVLAAVLGSVFFRRRKAE